MTKTLIIAEKPSVANDIAKVVGANNKDAHAFEGNDHIVSWALGHLVEFVEPEGYDDAFKRWRLADLPIIPEAFQVTPVRGAKKQLTALKKYLCSKDVSRVINACDAGREGELIFREIYRYSGTEKNVERLWLQSMTPKAIEESLNNLRSADVVSGLADAADCRAESDWLIGINATRALTVRLRSKKDRGVWSAGRVQTATLAMLVRRELEILAHVPEDYWMIKADFSVTGDTPHQYQGTWFDPGAAAPRDRIFDPERRDKIKQLLENKVPASATETRKDSRATAPPLFDLTTLQRESNRRFGFSARRTLQAAQQLYEGYKVITYPRTDSKALPSDYLEPVQHSLKHLKGTSVYGGFAASLLDQGLNNTERNFNDAAVSDHFAIIPTGDGDISGLTGDAAKVFDLIARRFLASFYPVAVSTEVERITTMQDESFRTRRKVLKIPGWRAVYDKETEENGADTLPPIGDPNAPTSVSLEEHTVEERATKPSARYNEAGLLGLMETAGKEIEDDHFAQVLKDTGGLGTPATRADIIETLLSREYGERCVSIDGKRVIRATARGIRLIESLRKINLPRLTSAELTASLENSLREVEEGSRNRPDYMSEIRSWTDEIVTAIREFKYEELYADTDPLGACPVCETVVRETMRTYSCEGEECQFVVWKEAGGRYVDRSTAEVLVKEGNTSKKQGFFTRDGREYEAALILNEDRKVELSIGLDDGVDGADFEPVDVADCPMCEGGIVARKANGYACKEKECGFKLPVQLCKRELQIEEVKQLIGPDRSTSLLEGFISRRNRPFSATLKLGDNGKITWDFPPREGGGGNAANAKKFPVNEEPLGACDCSDEAKAMETETEFKCSSDSCRRAVPREVCKRELTRDEVKTMFQGKESEVLEGFISKTGKPFAAKLYFKKNGRHGFRFPNR